MFYIVKIPWFIRKLFPSLIYNIDGSGKKIYITFDDGPIPETTPQILEILDRFDAKATFFCVGKNVQANKSLFDNLINKGHSVGNHSYNHCDGWKTQNRDYFNNIEKANSIINSKLFRPPYGRIKPSQIEFLRTKYNIIMWDVLSGDFDPNTAKEKCVKNVVDNVSSGSIVVFHDSIKAKDKVLYSLPRVLEILSQKGYEFVSLQNV